MEKHFNLGYLIPHLLKVPFGKRHTVAFPFGPLELPASYRGQVVVDIDACVGCGRCARDCPTGALHVERLEGGGVRVSLAYDSCATCGQCELSCNKGAIRLISAYTPPAKSRDALKIEWYKPGRQTKQTPDS